MTRTVWVLLVSLFGSGPPGVAQQISPRIYPFIDIAYRTIDLNPLANRYAAEKDSGGILYCKALSLIQEYRKTFTNNNYYFTELLKIKNALPATNPDAIYKVDFLLIEGLVSDKAYLVYNQKKLEEIIQHARRTNQPALKMRALIERSSIPFFLKQPIAKLENAVRIVESDPDLHRFQFPSLMLLYTEKAHISIGKGDTKRAIQYFSKSLAMAQQYHSPLYAQLNLLYLAQYYRNERQYQQSLTCAKKALSLLRVNPHPEFYRWAHQELGYTYTALHNTKAATYHWVKYSDFLIEQRKDAVRQGNFSSSYFGLLYEASEREKEQVSLEAKLTNMRVEARLQQNQLYLFISLFLIASLVALAFWYRSKTKLASETLLKNNLNTAVLQQKAMLHGQDMERSRIAQELHEGVGSMLAALKLNLATLLYPNATILGAVESLYTQVRNLSHQLHPTSLLPHGLEKACQNYLLLIDPGKRILFQRYGNEPTLAQEQLVHIFRIIQELLLNALRHSGATAILLELAFGATELLVKVEDNGQGMDLAQQPGENGIGLVNIQSRIELLQAQWELMSAPQEGTTVLLWVPIPHQGFP